MNVNSTNTNTIVKTEAPRRYLNPEECRYINTASSSIVKSSSCPEAVVLSLPTARYVIPLSTEQTKFDNVTVDIIDPIIRANSLMLQLKTKNKSFEMNGKSLGFSTKCGRHPYPPFQLIIYHQTNPLKKAWVQGNFTSKLSCNIPYDVDGFTVYTWNLCWKLIRDNHMCLKGECYMELIFPFANITTTTTLAFSARTPLANKKIEKLKRKRSEGNTPNTKPRTVYSQPNSLMNPVLRGNVKIKRASALSATQDTSNQKVVDETPIDISQYLALDEEEVTNPSSVSPEPKFNTVKEDIIFRLEDGTEFDTSDHDLELARDFLLQEFIEKDDTLVMFDKTDDIDPHTVLKVSSDEISEQLDTNCSDFLIFN